MSKRPYIQYSASSIKELIDSQPKDAKVLRDVIHEIKFRKKAKASLAAHLSKAQNLLKQIETGAASGAQSKPKPSTPPTTKQQINRKTKSAPNVVGTPEFSVDPEGDETPERPPQSPQILGKLGTIRKASSQLKKLPSVYSKELEETFEVRGLEEANTNAEVYLACLGGLIWEIRRGNNFAKTVHLVNGKKETSLSGEFGFIYAFQFDADEDFFEGARIDFKSGERKSKGSVISLLGGERKTLVISLDEDFGSSIKQCSISQDEAALLETLQKRFEIELGRSDKKSGSPVGMNTDLADLVVSGESEELIGTDISSKFFQGLNGGQRSFVKKAIKHSVSFLWGPPGTGKTQTLGALVSGFYAKDERTLICSNTNQAVDQVLLKLARNLRDQGRLGDLEDGKIVRVGRISQPELVEEFADYVTIDGIAERKGATIRSQVKGLEDKRDRLIKKMETINKDRSDFARLETLRKEERDHQKSLLDLEQKTESSLQERRLNAQKIDELKAEKTAVSSKGIFGKAFSRSVASIESDITSETRKNDQLQALLLALTEQLQELQANAPDNKSLISTIEKRLANKDVLQLSRTYDNFEEQVSAIDAELGALKKQLEEIRKTIISEALVVGATLTKVFLSPNDLGKCQNIIIDEASMGLVPAVYFAASQSQQRCIVSGDFRQLKPIAQTKNKTIFENIGRDIFEISGFEDTFVNRQDCDYADVLRDQYRMDHKICNLISEIGYEGQLMTAVDRQKASVPEVDLFNDSVTIIDTSPLYPFCDRDPSNSTSNVVHALAARNVFRTFHNQANDFTIGYCAPFRAQTKLVNKIIESENLSPRPAAGTVHTFQGDEKTIMVFDTVDSLGERPMLHIPLAQEAAAKSEIITVGVSRAAEKVIFIANLRYLDDKIPAQGYLRKILFKAQETGTIVDVRDVIDLAPLRDEIDELNFDYQDLNLTDDDLKSGLVNEDAFYPLVRRDIERAKKHICIFSGFYTAQRVAEFLGVLKKHLENDVKVKVVIPPPQNNGSMSAVDSFALIEKLMSRGVVVDLRGRLHQKAVLIDDDIAWFGSLNPLSFAGSTEESMIRINQSGVTGVFAANLSVKRGGNQEDSSMMVEPEVPNCGFCGAKAAFYKGRHGPYVKCIACEKTESIRRP